MPVGGHVGDLDGVVLGGVDGLGEVEADLLGVDVERGDELDVGDVVVAELDVHQARDGAGRVGVLVVLDALDQGAWRSCRRPRLLRVPNPWVSFLHCCAGVACWRRRGRCASAVAAGRSVAGRAVVGPRSALIRSESQRTSRSTDSTPCRCSSRGVAVDRLLGQRSCLWTRSRRSWRRVRRPSRIRSRISHVGAAEEREPDVEVVVLPGGRARPRYISRANSPCPAGGELVDDPLAAGRPVPVVGGLLDHDARAASSSGPGRASRRTAAGPSRASG